jgi:hypothetical protein
MNLYIIFRSDETGYDEFDSAVVAARNEDAARTIHPNGGINVVDDESSDTWIHPEYVRVTLIGKAVKGQTHGVILASFRAG